MKKSIISILVLFFISLSNLSFGLMSFFSFVMEKDIYNFSNTVSVQEQYTLLFNLPKDFVDICVKIQDDLKILKVNHNKVLFFDTDLNYFFNDFFATISSPLKLKTYYMYYKCHILDKVSNYSTGILTLFSVIFIFYILRYVGLLKLFSSHDYFITKNMYLNSIALSK
jgi:hypothetical protein